MGEMVTIYTNLAGKSERKIPLGRRNRMWENGIKWILKEQDVRVWNRSMCFRTKTNALCL
jgi:hypothetical protein